MPGPSKTSYKARLAAVMLLLIASSLHVVGTGEGIMKLWVFGDRTVVVEAHGQLMVPGKHHYTRGTLAATYSYRGNHLRLELTVAKNRTEVFRYPLRVSKESAKPQRTAIFWVFKYFCDGEHLVIQGEARLNTTSWRSINVSVSRRTGLARVRTAITYWNMHRAANMPVEKLVLIEELGREGLNWFKLLYRNVTVEKGRGNLFNITAYYEFLLDLDAVKSSENRSMVSSLLPDLFEPGRGGMNLSILDVRKPLVAGNLSNGDKLVKGLEWLETTRIAVEGMPASLKPLLNVALLVDLIYEIPFLYQRATYNPDPLVHFLRLLVDEVRAAESLVFDYLEPVDSEGRIEVNVMGSVMTYSLKTPRIPLPGLASLNLLQPFIKSLVSDVSKKLLFLLDIEDDPNVLAQQILDAWVELLPGDSTVVSIKPSALKLGELQGIKVVVSQQTETCTTSTPAPTGTATIRSLSNAIDMTLLALASMTVVAAALLARRRKRGVGEESSSL